MQILERLSLMDRVEAIALLKGNYGDFCSAVESTLERTHREEIIPADGSEEQLRLCKKARELRDRGYTRLQSILDRQSMAVPQAFAKALPERAALLEVHSAGVFDTQLEGLFWGRHASKFNTRISFNAQKTPPFLRPLFDCVTESEEIINKSIGIGGIKVGRNLLIVDNLQPTDTVDFQWWHFDRLYEQYKLMILLDDVSSANGPMRVLPGTHKFEGTRRIYDFCNYAEPHHGADPGYNVIKDRLADIVSVEGSAGDAFLFDSKIFHAHGRPVEAERNTATIYYQPPPTPLNLFYRKYQPEGQHVNY